MSVDCKERFRLTPNRCENYLRFLTINRTTSVMITMPRIPTVTDRPMTTLSLVEAINRKQQTSVSNVGPTESTFENNSQILYTTVTDRPMTTLSLMEAINRKLQLNVIHNSDGPTNDHAVSYGSYK